MRSIEPGENWRWCYEDDLLGNRERLGVRSRGASGRPGRVTSGNTKLFLQFKLHSTFDANAIAE